MSKMISKTTRSFAGGGFGAPSCGPSCDAPNHFVKIVVAGKNYLQEMDSCGNLVGEACPMGSCSVNADGVQWPFDDNGNQIIDFVDTTLVVTDDADFWYITDPATGEQAIICKRPVKSVNGITPDANGDVEFVIPMDVFVTGFEVQEIAGPNGSTMYQFVATLNNGSTIPYGPVMDTNTFGSVDSVTNADFFIFTYPDGTTASVCKNPLKSLSVNGGAPVGPDANGNVNVQVPGVVDQNGAPCPTNAAGDYIIDKSKISLTSNDGTVVLSQVGDNYDLSVLHPDDAIQSIICLDAQGQQLAVSVVNGVATIPFKPVIMRCQTSDGDFEPVVFAGGVYTIPYKPVSGIDIDGNVIPDLSTKPLVCGVIDGEGVALPTDGNGNVIVEQTSSTAVSDGVTTTTTHPDGTTHVSCDNPVKSVNGVGPDAVGDVVVGQSTAVDDGVSTTTTHPDGTTHVSCNDPVKSVSGPGIDNTDPANPVHSASSTVAAPEGFHTITTADGVMTAVCLNPLKSINGIAGDINGNVDVADVFSNTVDNGDGTYTTTNSDGSTVTWSGDTFATQMDNGDGTVTFTMADGSTVTLCLNPVKSVVQGADGVTTVTWADGTVGAINGSTAVSDGVTTTTTHPDGTIHTSCDNPVKDVLDAAGSSVVVDGVATLPPAATSGFTTNGDGTTTHDDGNGNTTVNIQEDIVDGGSNLVAADGVTINPILKKDGTPADVTVDSFLATTDVPDVNALPVAIECDNKAIKMTQCDGTELWFSSQSVNQSVGIAPGGITTVNQDNWTEDLVLAESNCIEVCQGQCGGSLEIEIYSSYALSLTQVGSGAAPVNFGPQVSFNGGATFPLLMSTGGADSINLFNIEGAESAGEFSFWDKRTWDRAPNDLISVCFQIATRPVTVDLSDDEFEITPKSAQMHVNTNEMRCC